MKKKVVIIQDYNTPYRNELFNRIAEYEDIDLTLLYVSQKSENRQWQDHLESRFREVQVNCSVQTVDFETIRTRLDYTDFIRKIWSLDPDIVISQLGKLTVLIRYSMFWKRVPLVIWSEATMITEGGRNWFEKPYLKHHMHLAKAFLVPGRMAREYLEYCGFELQNRMFNAPNSVDECYCIAESDFANKFTPHAPVRFLFVGSFVERKGFHLVNAVFRRLRQLRTDFEFHVAGAGPIEPAAGMIHHGFVTKNESLELYRNSHIFLMPSLWDCNPLSVIEAAKTGNVIVASDGVGNHPELINGNGFVFAANHEDELFQACKTLLEKSNAELEAMGRRSLALSEPISHEASARSFHEAIACAFHESACSGRRIRAAGMSG